MKYSKKLFTAASAVIFCLFLTIIPACLDDDDNTSSTDYRTLNVTVNYTSGTVDENSPIYIYTFNSSDFNDEAAVSIGASEENGMEVSLLVNTSPVYVAVFYDSDHDYLPSTGEAYEIYEDTGFISGEASDPEAVSIAPQGTESISIEFDDTHTFITGDPML